MYVDEVLISKTGIESNLFLKFSAVDLACGTTVGCVARASAVLIDDESSGDTVDTCFSFCVDLAWCFVFARFPLPSFNAVAREYFDEIVAGTVFADVECALFVCVAYPVVILVVVDGGSSAVLFAGASLASFGFDAVASVCGVYVVVACDGVLASRDFVLVACAVTVCIVVDDVSGAVLFS